MFVKKETINGEKINIFWDSSHGVLVHRCVISRYVSFPIWGDMTSKRIMETMAGYGLTPGEHYVVLNKEECSAITGRKNTVQNSVMFKTAGVMVVANHLENQYNYRHMMQIYSCLKAVEHMMKRKGATELMVQANEKSTTVKSATPGYETFVAKPSGYNVVCGNQNFYTWLVNNTLLMPSAAVSYFAYGRPYFTTTDKLIQSMRKAGLVESVDFVCVSYNREQIIVATTIEAMIRFAQKTNPVKNDLIQATKLSFENVAKKEGFKLELVETAKVIEQQTELFDECDTQQEKENNNLPNLPTVRTEQLPAKIEAAEPQQKLKRKYTRRQIHVNPIDKLVDSAADLLLDAMVEKMTSERFISRVVKAFEKKVKDRKAV